MWWMLAKIRASVGRQALMMRVIIEVGEGGFEREEDVYCVSSRRITGAATDVG